MDDRKNKGQPDRSKINMHEAHEVKYWTHQLGVSREKLQGGGGESRQCGCGSAQGTGALECRCIGLGEQTRTAPDRVPFCCVVYPGRQMPMGTP